MTRKIPFKPRSSGDQLQRAAVLAGVQLAANGGGVLSVTLGAIADAVGVSKQRLHTIQPIADWHKDITAAAAALDVWPVLADMILNPKAPRVAVSDRQLKCVSAWLVQRGRDNVGE